LVPRSDEFEGQGLKSKVKVTSDKTAFFGPSGSLRSVYVWKNIFALLNIHICSFSIEFLGDRL